MNRSGERSNFRRPRVLFALLGRDITTIDGLGPYLSLKLIAECGDDLSLQVQSILPPAGLREQQVSAKSSRLERADPLGARFCALPPSPSAHRHGARAFYGDFHHASQAKQ